MNSLSWFTQFSICRRELTGRCKVLLEALVTILIRNIEVDNDVVNIADQHIVKSTSIQRLECRLYIVPVFQWSSFRISILSRIILENIIQQGFRFSEIYDRSGNWPILPRRLETIFLEPNQITIESIAGIRIEVSGSFLHESSFGHRIRHFCILTVFAIHSP